MIPIKVYLDTSVINFLYAEDAPEKKEITLEFFDMYVKEGIYIVFISPIVIDEINRTNDEDKRNKLLGVVKTYNINVIDITEEKTEIAKLSSLYIEQSAIPKDKLEDAMHIAIATINEMDILLSWNYKHLANINKERIISAINLLAGYTKPLKMVTPMEVVYEKE